VAQPSVPFAEIGTPTRPFQTGTGQANAAQAGNALAHEPRHFFERFLSAGLMRDPPSRRVLNSFLLLLLNVFRRESTAPPGRCQSRRRDDLTISQSWV
jgi:hypothetical protein